MNQSPSLSISFKTLKDYQRYNYLKRIYPYIYAWGKYNGWNGYYITDEMALAEEKAPEGCINPVYRAWNPATRKHTWVLLEDLENIPLKAALTKIAQDMLKELDATDSTSASPT